jgi:Tol biopolymer transport system component
VHQVGTVVAAADAVSWSPEGGQLVFVDGTGGISKVNEDGTELTSITANGSSPAWSPDGKTIVFRQAPKLYAMNADGRGMHVLIRPPNSNEHIYSDAAPSWSPDGKHVVFVRTDLFRIIKPGAVAIEIVNPDGTGERVVARISFTEPDVARPSWSPDGTKIAFAGQQNGRRGIWAVKSTGGMPRLFAESNAYAMPSWGPAGT